MIVDYYYLFSFPEVSSFILVGKFDFQALERRELEFEANYFTRTSALLAEVADLEGKLANGCDSLSLSDALSDSLNEAEERLKLAKKVN